MSIEFDATYRAGALHPDQPIALPENAPVRVLVVERDVPPHVVSTKGLSRAEIIALRPKSPRFTGDELRALIAKHAVSVGALPPDFSREDIYSDHD